MAAEDPGEIREGDPLTAGWLDGLRRLILRAAHLMVEAPLELASIDGLRRVRLARPRPILARLTRLEPLARAYDWVEVHADSPTTHATLAGGRSGTANAFESNLANDIPVGINGGAVVELRPGHDGADWRFQWHRRGGVGCTGESCVRLISEATGLPIAGAGVAVRVNSGGGYATIASGTTDADGRFCATFSRTATHSFDFTIPTAWGVDATFSVITVGVRPCTQVREFAFCAAKVCLTFEDCVTHAELDLCRYQYDAGCDPGASFLLSRGFAGQDGPTTSGFKESHFHNQPGDVVARWPYCDYYFRLTETPYTPGPTTLVASGRKVAAHSDLCDVSGNYRPGCRHFAIECGGEADITVGLFPYGSDYTKPPINPVPADNGCDPECVDVSPYADSACSPAGLIRKTLYLTIHANDSWNSYGDLVGVPTELSCDASGGLTTLRYTSGCITPGAGGILKTSTFGGVDYYSWGGYACGPGNITQGAPPPTVHAFGSTRIQFSIGASNVLTGTNYLFGGCTDTGTPCPVGENFGLGVGKTWRLRSITSYRVCSPTLIEGTIEVPGYGEPVPFTIAES